MTCKSGGFHALILWQRPSKDKAVVNVLGDLKCFQPMLIFIYFLVENQHALNIIISFYI